MAVEGILGAIVERTLEDIQGRRRAADLTGLRRSGEAKARGRLSLKHALADGRFTEPRFLCEVKKASPSKGVFREDFDPSRLAAAYAEGGASALSVVTEPHFFQGSLNLLDAVRTTSGNRPILRKDFHVHELQIYETAASPADALLLIVSVLSPVQLKDYLDMARAFRLEALVEVTDRSEADIALKAGADIIGVNNRDLRTFTVDPGRTERVLPLLIESGVVAVAESGVHSRATVLRLWSAGVDAFLVGEALVRSADPRRTLAELRGLLDTDSAP